MTKRSVIGPDGTPYEYDVDDGMPPNEPYRILVRQPPTLQEVEVALAVAMWGHDFSNPEVNATARALAPAVHAHLRGEARVTQPTTDPDTKTITAKDLTDALTDHFIDKNMGMPGPRQERMAADIWFRLPVRADRPQGPCCENGDFGDGHDCRKSEGRADRPPEPPTARRQPTTKAGKRLLADCAGLVEQPNETPRIVAKAAELLCQVLIPRIEDEARAALGASPPPPDLSVVLDAKPYEWLDGYSGSKGWEEAMTLVRAALGRATPEEPSR